MKLFVAFACLVVAISAASDQDLWVEFKNNHGKTYRDLRQEKLRFNIFQEKLREIESHNAKYEKGEVTYFLNVNQFSDLTTDEFVALLNKNVATKPKLHTTSFENRVKDNSTEPEEINWVEKGAVLGVKRQGLTCGSSWAFSATGSVEGYNAIRHNKTVPLSEQQLLDCADENEGCNGGNMENALSYILVNGIAAESDYPYEGTDGTCKSAKVACKIGGTSYLTGFGEDTLKSLVATIGPISVGVQADLWQSYGGGVFDNPLCSDNLNLGVLAVGYGKANGTDYWLIKNSWGESWGEQGYIRLVRNKSNQCGVAKEAAYPQ